LQPIAADSGKNTIENDMGSTKNWFMIIGAIIVAFIAWKIVAGILGLFLPLLIVGGAAYLVYRVANKQPILPGGRKRTLP